VWAVETTAAFADPGPAAEELVRGYLSDWLAHTRGRVRAVTYEGYETLLRRHALPTLGGLPLREVTPMDVQRLYSGLLSGEIGPGLSAGSVLNLHLVLTQAFAQAVRWQLLIANPVAGAQPPRPRRASPVLVDPALLARLVDSTRGTWLEVPAAVAAATGMRRGEILALRWQDIDADFGAARVVRSLQPTRDGLVFEQPKTPRSRRTVVLPGFLYPHLTRHREEQSARREQSKAWQDHGLLIERGDGRPLNPDTLSAGWARHLRSKHLPRVRFHDLRHAHATLMLAQGVHPKVVSERLGHASIGITLDLYSHVLPTMQHDAVAAFDALFP
jgi:integrase